MRRYSKTTMRSTLTICWYTELSFSQNTKKLRYGVTIYSLMNCQWSFYYTRKTNINLSVYSSARIPTRCNMSSWKLLGFDGELPSLATPTSQVCLVLFQLNYLILGFLVYGWRSAEVGNLSRMRDGEIPLFLLLLLDISDVDVQKISLQFNKYSWSKTIGLQRPY